MKFFEPNGQALTDSAGSVPPTAEELYKALDDLHIVCECATVPEVEEWYRRDPFASEARKNAINVLLRYHHSQNNQIGKTVEVEDHGRGTIIGHENGMVFVRLDPPGCRMLTIPETALEPNNKAGNHP